MKKNIEIYRFTTNGYNIEFYKDGTKPNFPAKKYTVEDMQKCYHKARELKNNLPIADTNPSFFKYPELKDYLESLK